MRHHRASAAVALALTGLALAGCASADKTTSTGSSMAGMQMSSGSGSGNAGGVSGSNSSVGSSSAAMKTTTVLNASGVPTPVPVQTIGSATWKDMSITAQTMTPVPFYVDNGTSFREIKPTPKTSFHLMVMLNDRHTGVAIPYATVWAVISKRGKVVFNERQWDMIAEFMGPHYGNDVTLPGPGRYQLKLLITAPTAAMHSEYADMWTGTHSVTSSFVWKGTGSST